MPAIKEHWKKRKYREKMMREHERKPREPKPLNRAPSCQTCPYLTIKQWYKPIKKRGVQSMRWQCYCIHPVAHAKGNNAIGPPQLEETLEDVYVPSRRPKWCPIDKEHKLGEIRFDENLSE